MSRRAFQVDEVIINDELAHRPSRPPDFEAENQTLVALAEVMAESPRAALQALANAAFELCQADSAGITIKEAGTDEDLFRWHATAGAFAPYLGGTMPWESTPCGTVLDRNAPVLMADPARVFPAVAALSLPVVEVLLIPFYRGETPIGTIWAVAHTPDKQFDAEDVRILKGLSRFASAAVRALRNREATEVAEQELRVARTRLDSALEAAAVATWTWDIPADHVVADRNFARICSISPDDAAGGPFASSMRAIHPEDRERVASTIEDAIRSGSKFEAECRVVQADGSCRWIIAQGRPERDAAGRPRSLSGAIVDITEQKRSEQAVARSEARFRAFVTASSDVLYRMSPDWSEMHHVGGREFIAGSDGPNRTWLEKYIDPEDRPRVLDAISKAVQTKRTFELEHRVRRVDGTVGWTFSRAVPILDENNDIVEWFGTASDVTRQKEAETRRQRIQEEAERQRRLYEAALSNTPDLVYIFGLDYRFIYANEALLRMWGRTRDEALGRSLPELGYPPWHAAMHEREIDQVVATKQPIRGEVPFHGTNGRRIYDYIFVPVLGDAGEVVAVAGTTRDVTERQQAEQAIREQAEQLQENDRRKDEFLAMLAHELRNPLSAIGNAVALSSRTGLREDVDWALEVIGRQMRHLTHLIDDLLDVSRINRGKIELRHGVHNLAPILDSALATTRPLIEERKHTLEIAIDRGDLWADVDPTRLEQVLVNLLHNAAKYSENGGSIRLSAHNEQNEVAITIEDRGLGIHPDMLPQMFELFVQGDRSLARSEGGLGIGLTVVKKLVEMHGGRIEARSDGPRQGSKFTVRLPRAARPITSSSTRPLSPGSAVRRSQILVVDDNLDTARGMARLLTRLGHAVAVAHDGPQGIEMAKQHHPAFILLDIGLPGMDGYEVARRLRTAESSKECVIIAISGYGQDSDRRRSKEAGIDHHLVKPLDHDALLAILSAGGSTTDEVSVPTLLHQGH